MASKGTGKSHTLYEIHSQLSMKDQEFLDSLFPDESFCFELLKIADIVVPVELVRILLDTYDKENKVFLCNDVRLFITLEDILYLTGLKIRGSLIANARKDKLAFKEVFGIKTNKTKWPLQDIKSIVLDVARPREVRVKTLLLMLVTCFVVPTCDNHMVKADHIACVNDLDKVKDYSWGLALLSFLHSGIKKWKDDTDPKSSIDGNLWVVLQVSWTPYAEVELPVNLKNEEKFVLLLCPICYMNSLVYHKPHFTPEQFPKLKEVDLGQITRVRVDLPKKQISGPFPQNFEEIFKVDLKDWVDKKLVIDFLPQSFKDDQSDPVSPEPKRGNFDYDSVPDDLLQNLQSFEKSRSVEEFDEDTSLVEKSRSVEDFDEDLPLIRLFANLQKRARKESPDEDREEHRDEEVTMETKKKRNKANNLVSSSMSRPKRRIKNVSKSNTYENGHNVAYWRKNVSSINKVCSFLDALDESDTVVVVQSCGNYATVKDCQFYKNNTRLPS